MNCFATDKKKSMIARRVLPLSMLLIIALISLLTALLAIGLTACEPLTDDSVEVVSEYEYTSDIFAYIQLANFSLKEYQTDIAVNKTTTKYAIYHFDEDIETSECNRFATFADNILEFLDKNDDNLPYIFISDRIKTPRADNDTNTLYFSISNTKSVELIIYILQLQQANTLNYGLLYGRSAQIFNDLKWGKLDIFNESQIKTFLKKQENRYILDLTYPIFHEKFSNKEQIDFAKSISIRLADFIKKNHGKQAFTELYQANQNFDMTFDNLFYGYLNNYLAKIDVEKVEINSDVIKIVPNTYDFPFIIITVSCEYYMYSDWEDERTSGFYTYNDFECNYPSVKAILLDVETYLAGVRDFFDFETSKKYKVYMQNMLNYAGLASSDGLYIILDSLHAITHEYAHIISFEKYGYVYSWALEAVAYYCGTVIDDLYGKEYHAAFIDIQAYEEIIGETPEIIGYIFDNYMELSEKENYYLRFLEAYIYVVFLERDLEKSIIAKMYEYIDKNLAAFNVIFSDYLITAYGKEKYLELYASAADFSAVYGKNQPELLKEYLEILQIIFNPDSNI